MATIKQLADAEADAAEAEADELDEGDETEPGEGDETEPDEGDEPEPEPEPEPAEPSQPDVDSAVREIDRAGDDYTAYVKESGLAATLGLVECPLCPVPGFVTEIPPPEIDPMQRLAVLTAMGEAQTEPPPEHPRLHRCEACDGHGLLPTGSRRAEYENHPCDVCNGQGYTDRTMEQAQADARAMDNVSTLPLPVTTPPGPPQLAGATMMVQGGYSFPYVPGGSPDQHGRFAGHPLWGQDAAVGGL